MASKKYIVITRPVGENKELDEEFSKLGFSTVYLPSIAINKNGLTKDSQLALENLESYDWIVFTSKNGVRFFIDSLKELHIDLRKITQKQIAVVGPKTEEEAKRYGLPVHFIPSKFTTSDLAKEFPDIKNKKLLLPRANIATPLLTKQLEEKGAFVVNIPIYKTTYKKSSINYFEKLVKKNEIAYLTFTSPSTVDGFLRNTINLKNADIFSIPTIAIGPVTSTTLKSNGFKKIITADTFTIDGLISKVKENIL